MFQGESLEQYVRTHFNYWHTEIAKKARFSGTYLKKNDTAKSQKLFRGTFRYSRAETW